VCAQPIQGRALRGVATRSKRTYHDRRALLDAGPPRITALPRSVTSASEVPRRAAAATCHRRRSLRGSLPMRVVRRAGLCPIAAEWRRFAHLPASADALVCLPFLASAYTVAPSLGSPDVRRTGSSLANVRQIWPVDSLSRSRAEHLRRSRSSSPRYPCQIVLALGMAWMLEAPVRARLVFCIWTSRPASRSRTLRAGLASRGSRAAGFRLLNTSSLAWAAIFRSAGLLSYETPNTPCVPWAMAAAARNLRAKRSPSLLGDPVRGCTA